MFHDKDDARVWRVIDWQSNFDVCIHGEEVSPNDEEFKAHFERVLNPRSVFPDCDVSADVTIPVLDCHISPAEVSGHSKNSIVKLYDMVLCNRLSLRFEPSREQAGAQKTRRFFEHIVTLRLLTDSARRKNKKLFVTFITDVMPLHKMFITLKRLGCGMVTLAALIVMYNLTESVYGCAIITSIVEVR